MSSKSGMSFSFKVPTEILYQSVPLGQPNAVKGTNANCARLIKNEEISAVVSMVFPSNCFLPIKANCAVK